MKTNPMRVVAFAALIGLGSNASADTIIDLFTDDGGGQVLMVMPVTAGPVPLTKMGLSNVVGGTRTIALANVAGDTSANATLGVDTGQQHLEYSNDAGVTSTGFVQYPNLNGFDLIGVNPINEEFLVNIVTIDQDLTIDVTIEDESGNKAIGTYNVDANDDGNTLSMLLSSFVNQQVAQTDFTDVKTITLDFTGPEAFDIQIGFFRTQGQAEGVIPEPGSVLLWGALSAVAGLAVWRRRRRAAA